MDLQSDEMFKILKFKMAEWSAASKLASSAVNQLGTAGLATKNKKKPGQTEETKKEAVVFQNTTPAGEKKDMSQPMASEYYPQQVESAWYSWWEKQKFFHANAQRALAKSEQKSFVMVIPPPNVTGALHLGHALMLSVEDAIVRWKRMSGYETLWLPGVDHAGISTQSVVEKQLWKKGKQTRHDLGREKFTETVWAWKNDYGDRINHQFRRFGISVDWDRFAFTLDDTRYKAVMEAFVIMHEKGLIYRATRLINWSSSLKTALSDLEVEYIDLKGPTLLKVPGHDPNKQYEFGTLTEFAYKIKGTDKEIVVATTRLETMLGDVAVAVHPDDERYKDLLGKELEHPFIKDRSMKIIADGELVDPTFGTGAVKITPAHDHNDYNCGKRHGLQMINILDEDGRINSNGGKYEGVMRFDCRNDIYKDLQALGLIRGKRPNEMRLGLCSKTSDVIEPFLKPQWYADCKELAKRSCDAVRSKELVILPEIHEKTWFDWLEKIQDWCISRQLWWGHRIPAYLVRIKGVIDNPDNQNNEHYVVGRNEQEARDKAAKKFNVDPSIIELTQDEDVLDTWFSSGLFPFSTMGWPDKSTEDMKAFFPGDLLETGTDILFFWVARMVMMSLCLTDKLPFKYVYLHPMVRDEKGKKMSKSKGNVIDPLEVMDGCTLDALLQKLTDSNLPESEIKEATSDKKLKCPDGIPECGTDALRFGLLSYMNQNNINMDVQRVVGYRQFCNKLWNIVKFALTNLPEGFDPSPESIESFKLSLADKWILTRLSKLIENTNQSFQNYKFGDMVMGLYDFWLKELADVYIEAIKPVMKGQDEDAKKAARNTLYICLDHGLKLLHPSMPYLTEELFQRLPQKKDATNLEQNSICIASYPTKLVSYDSEDVEDKIKLLLNAVKAFRSQLSALNVAKSATPHIAIKCKTEELKKVFAGDTAIIQSLVKTAQVDVLGPSDEEPTGSLKNIVTEDLFAYIKVVGLIDIKLEIERLNKRNAQLQKFADDTLKKNQSAKIPENIKKENNEKIATYDNEKAENEKSINVLKAFV